MLCPCMSVLSWFSSMSVTVVIPITNVVTAVLIATQHFAKLLPLLRS
jgi:hypothetical protein